MAARSAIDGCFAQAFEAFDDWELQSITAGLEAIVSALRTPESNPSEATRE